MPNTEAIMEFSFLDFAFSIITFFVLFLILKHFFFEKVHNFMEQRSREIQDSIDSAEDLNRMAEKRLQDYEDQLSGAEAEGRKIIKDARVEAKLQANSIIQSANEEARANLKQSREEIERERYNARKELRDEVGELAMAAARQILEKEIDEDEHRHIIDKILEEAKEDPWK